MIKGILFDKDGTLLDFNATWLEPYFQVTQYLADSMGQPDLGDQLMREGGYIPESQTWITDSLLASGSNAQIFEFWEEQIGQPIHGEQLAHIKSIFGHAASSYVPALDDLPGFLNGLKQRGMLLGVATMDYESNAYGMLAQLEITDLFDFVCGADSGFGVKPEPGMVHGFCDRCGISPDQMIMVGDSPKDLNMGKNSGAAYSVGVLTGAHDREELSKYSDNVFDDIAGLEPFLDTNEPA